jgi:hypothetical protein
MIFTTLIWVITFFSKYVCFSNQHVSLFQLIEFSVCFFLCQGLFKHIYYIFSRSPAAGGL